MGLAQMSRVLSEVREQSLAEHASASGDDAAKRESWLLFRIGREGRVAIPLSLVSRLEEFSAAKIERYAGREVIQYREQIMPLVRLSEALGYSGTADSEMLQVVVYSSNGRSVGLVVDEILDIADEAAAAQQIRQVKTLKGAAVIQQRVTDLLDVSALLAEQKLMLMEGAQA
jgi:two-component system chemotaxis sensor kinase CheA